MTRPVLIPGSDVELVELALIDWIETMREHGRTEYFEQLLELKERLFDDDQP